MGARVVGAIRLTHPFPSILDGVVSGSVAILAGAGPLVGFELGLAMTALQLGIGAINDVVDAPHDAGHKPGKPIPAGLVSRPVGGLIGLAAFGLGLLLAFLVGPLAFGLALVVIAIGLAYDLRLKGTAWSWLPFAIGIPMLPVFGWAGATGGLTAMFAVLVPAAVAAGAALAIANSLVDVDRDRDAGVSSVAIALGEGRARVVGIVLLGTIALAAATSTLASGGGPTATLIVGLLGCVPPVAAGLARHRNPRGRELAWTAQAIGLGALAVAWIEAIAR
jgi:4-hydroxybenzoate polyprenyltransferase